MRSSKLALEMLQALAALHCALVAFEGAVGSDDLVAAAGHARTARERALFVASQMADAPLTAAVGARCDGCDQKLAEAARRC
eukprot:1944679-Prymnesium_polylepis.1